MLSNPDFVSGSTFDPTDDTTKEFIFEVVGSSAITYDPPNSVLTI